MLKILTLSLVACMFVTMGAAGLQEKPQAQRAPDKPRAEAADHVRPAINFRIVSESGGPGARAGLEAKLKEHGKWGWEAVSMVYDGRSYVVLMTLKPMTAPNRSEGR